ncbi:glycosyltransferase family 4 protein [Flavobacterium sp.]|uniref:glycosyltransferase family 4 protein n=1 Tax=Flavobacterium sp. TaxID=239 RepID=UPI004047C0E5
MELNKKIIFYVVNVDWFFLSHRKELAIEGIRRGYDIYLLSKDTGQFKLLHQLGIKTIDIPFDRKKNTYFNDLCAFIKLCRMFNRHKPDIIHNVGLKSIILGSLACTLYGRKSKLINAVSGLGYIFSNNNRSVLKSIILLLLRCILYFKKNNTKFIFQNPSDKNLFVNEKISSNISSFIIKGSGVDEIKFKPKNREIKQGQIIRITLVARMLKDKGILDFIFAAHICHKKLKGKVLFKLVGGLDLDNPSALQEHEIKELLIENYIVWEGKSSNIINVYENTEIACLPSYREGMPKSLVEAMSMECVILTTDVPGCQDCVEDGINGFLFPPRSPKEISEKIIILLNDFELIIKMGKESRNKMLTDMTLNHIVKTTYEIYQD